jgi:lipopolysaccharide transport system ATP-binding protein
MAHKEDGGRPVIRLRNVAVSYNKGKNILSKSRYFALRDVSFDLYHGETLGVIGRNGVGKTTLLKLLAGIIDPDGGEIWRETNRVSLLSLKLGFMPHLSGGENAVLSGLLQGMALSEVQASLESMREYSELGEFWDEPVSIYSAGMVTRLGFSVAINVDPDVLLIDEVLGVGDAAFRAKSTETIKGKIATDRTVVLVSHNVSTLRSLCDRVVWIENGKTLMEGEADTVLTQYENTEQSARKN